MSELRPSDGPDTEAGHRDLFMTRLCQRLTLSMCAVFQFGYLAWPHAELTTGAPGTPGCLDCNVLSELGSANVITMGRVITAKQLQQTSLPLWLSLKTNYSHIYGFNLTSDM